MVTNMSQNRKYSKSVEEKYEDWLENSYASFVKGRRSYSVKKNSNCNIMGFSGIFYEHSDLCENTGYIAYKPLFSNVTCLYMFKGRKAKNRAERVIGYYILGRVLLALIILAIPIVLLLLLKGV